MIAGSANLKSCTAPSRSCSAILTLRRVGSADLVEGECATVNGFARSPREASHGRRMLLASQTHYRERGQRNRSLSSNAAV
jgi:hypothetical protein